LTPGFRLYCFAQSGNAYKVALMLNLCGAKWEPRFVDFFNGETRTPEYREKINEMGEVPVLEHGAKRLSQSGVILHYLADHFGKYQGEDKLEVLRWMLWDNHKLTSYIATLRFFIQFQKSGETPVTEFLRGRVRSSLVILDKHLKKSSFVVGKEPSIADLSLCGYLYWPDEFGVSWAEFPLVGAWLERIKALPGWVRPYELMPGHPLKG
jgi:glutathione S-transferase